MAIDGSAEKQDTSTRVIPTSLNGSALTAYMMAREAARLRAALSGEVIDDPDAPENADQIAVLGDITRARLSREEAVRYDLAHDMSPTLAGSDARTWQDFLGIQVVGRDTIKADNK